VVRLKKIPERAGRMAFLEQGSFFEVESPDLFFTDYVSQGSMGGDIS